MRSASRMEPNTEKVRAMAIPVLGQTTTLANNALSPSLNIQAIAFPSDLPHMPQSPSEALEPLPSPRPRHAHTPVTTNTYLMLLGSILPLPLLSY
jgi:hypothetical protein